MTRFDGTEAPHDIQDILSEIFDDSARGLIENGNDLLQSGQSRAVVWVEPDDETQMADVFSMASEHAWKVAIVGAGTQLAAGRPGESVDVVVRTSRMNRVLEFAPGDLVVTVQPGVRLEDLQAVLAGEGKMLPLDPWVNEKATIGGIAASGISGPRRALYGTVRDMAIGLRVVYPDGQVIRTGGKVVKNVAGYDLTKLFIGSYGTLGAMSELTFKLRPAPLHRETVLLYGTLEQITRVQRRLLTSVLIPSRAEAIYREAEWVLAVDCDENETSARYQTDQLFTLAKSEGMSCDVRRGDDADNWWTHARRLAFDASLVVRVSVPPTEWAVLADTVSQLAQRLKERHEAGAKREFLADDLTMRYGEMVDRREPFDIIHTFGVTVGVGRIFLTGISEQEGVDTVAKLYESTKRRGGTAVVERADYGIRQRIDELRDVAATRGLFQRIKQQIDPGCVLREGIHAGGI
ncbi:FAD-binding oxidoreductase [Alicyclobacillus curvatus]|nr:FAD-binding oxidoreductase [Alicyclobacillus curvatus]